MKYFLSILIVIYSHSVSAEIKTTLDFDSLFPDISKASQKLEAKLQKKNGGKPLTAGELANITSRMTEELTIKRNTAILQVRKHCYEEISQLCGHYESFSDPMRTCITTYRGYFAESCNKALKDNIGEKLAQDTIIDGLNIPKGSMLIYDHNEKIIGAISSTKSVYNNILFKSGEIRFENGIVTSGNLPQDTVIQDVMFKGLDKGGMLFHPNGVVKRGMLAQDTYYQGLTLKAHTIIQLHPNRYFQSGILAQDITLGERTYKAGTYLYANERAEMSDDQTILLKHTRKKTTSKK